VEEFRVERKVEEKMVELKSMALTMPEVAGHPNRVPFEGVLTMVDVPSEQSPSGAKGHRVVLTKRAAETALPSLLGMALDYSPSLDRHDVRRKVGVITRAEIVGRSLELGGYLFARDFPEIVEEIAKEGVLRTHSSSFSDARREAGAQIASSRMERPWRKSLDEGSRLRSSLRAAAQRILQLTSTSAPAFEKKNEWRVTMTSDSCINAGASALGLSYEVTDVQIDDMRAQVWILTKVTFTGAAILRRDKAAYRNTWIELSA
jgi:hypothetical protein